MVSYPVFVNVRGFVSHKEKVMPDLETRLRSLIQRLEATAAKNEMSYTSDPTVSDASCTRRVAIGARYASNILKDLLDGDGDDVRLS